MMQIPIVPAQSSLFVTSNHHTRYGIAQRTKIAHVMSALKKVCTRGVKSVKTSICLLMVNARTLTETFTTAQPVHIYIVVNATPINKVKFVSHAKKAILSKMTKTVNVSKLQNKFAQLKVWSENTVLPMTTIVSMNVVSKKSLTVTQTNVFVVLCPKRRKLSQNITACVSSTNQP
jgi:hypothetical protein